MRTASHLVRWDWGPPTLHELAAAGSGSGQWAEVSVDYAPYEWSEFTYLTGAIRSMIDALSSADPPAAALAISGADVRAALEVATAAHHSSIGGAVPVALPLADRSADPLYPRPYRWVGGDAQPPLRGGGLGDATPQPTDELRREINGHGPRPKL